MNDLNSVILEGRVSRKPVLNTVGNSEVCTFDIAVSDSFKKNDGTYDKKVSYFSIKSWGNMAKVCNQYLSIGRKVRVVGKLVQDIWDDKELGKKREKVYISSESIEFAPVKKGEKAEEKK